MTGVYSFSRHPSYFGWFLWSIGTHLLLSNFVSFGLYFYASIRFFKGRIEYEEEHLKDFFGGKYEDYIKKVPHRIPFIEDKGQTKKKGKKSE